MIQFVIPLGVYFIASIIISYKDIRTMHLPVYIIYLCLFFFITFDFLTDKNNLLYNGIGAAINFMIFNVVRIITKKGLGLGDVQLSILTGYFAGFPLLFLSDFIAAVIGLLYFGILYMLHVNIRNKKIPFAPFMSLGAICVSVITFLGITNKLLLQWSLR